MFSIYFMIDVMYWNYDYVKDLVIVFTLLGFHLFMVNNSHFNSVYCNWFISFTFMNMLVFNLILCFFFNDHYYYCYF